MYAYGSHDNSDRLGSPICLRREESTFIGIHVLRFNSGHSLPRDNDCLLSSVFDADKVHGFVAQCLANLSSMIDLMEDMSVACQGDGAEPLVFHGEEAHAR